MFMDRRYVSTGNEGPSRTHAEVILVAFWTHAEIKLPTVVEARALDNAFTA
jgi:hypothetical protein